jgi:multiple sugar transport system substrate-binding protein
MPIEGELGAPTSRRQFIWSGAALAAGAVIAGCGGSDAASSGGGAKKVAGAAKGDLRWGMFSDTPSDRKIWTTLAGDAETRYPGLEVKLETAGFNDYWDKLATQISSKSQPDIVTMQSLRMPAFVVRKALLPLDGYIKGDSATNYDDFFPAGRDGLTVKDRPYALGYDIGPIVMYYNKDLFRKAGVPLPPQDRPYTWEEFRSACRELTSAAAKQYGFVMQPSFDSTIPWLWSGGGDFMDAGQKTCTLDSDASRQALEFIAGIFTKDRTGAPVTDLSNYQFGSERFFAGNVGMFIDGPWQIAGLKATAKFDWDLAPVPAGPGGSVTWAAGSGFGVSTSAKDPDTAWKAIQALTSTESLTKLVDAGRGFPARASSAAGYSKQPAPPKHPDVVQGILDGSVAKARPLNTTTTWQETEVMLARDFTPVFLGRQSVADTVAKVKPQFDQLLQRHQQLLQRL